MRNLQAPGPTQRSLVERKNAITATESVTTLGTAVLDAETLDPALLVVITETDRIQETEDVEMTDVDLHLSDIAGEAPTETTGEEMSLQDVITIVITARRYAEDHQKRTPDVSLL